MNLIFVLPFLLFAGKAFADKDPAQNGIVEKNQNVQIYRVQRDSNGTPVRRTPVTSLSVVDMLPSWKICKTPALPSVDTYEILNCAGCTVTFSLTKGTTYNTGHESGHSGTHPVGTIVGKTLGTPYTIGSSYYTFDFEAPDVSVETLMSLNIQIPNPPNPPTNTTWDTTILVYVPDLVDQSGLSDITFNGITSHPGNGTYMTYAAGNFLVDALIDYNNGAAGTYGVPTGSIVKPNSEGASLQYGGLFDINKDFSTPHCRHREGKSLDIGMSLFANSPYKTDLLDALEAAFLGQGFAFPFSGERPSDPSSTHWHAEI